MVETQTVVTVFSGVLTQENPAILHLHPWLNCNPKNRKFQGKIYFCYFLIKQYPVIFCIYNSI